MSARAIEARFAVRAGSFRTEAELALDEGVLVLFGPSGSGKSTTLKAIAGLLRPESGRIVVGGETYFDADRGIEIPAHRRRIGYVPQHHALFPFLDVARNVAFGLPRPERRADHPRVRTLLEELGIAHLHEARPADLSGGERQRVSLARALAVSPRLLVLDEPFSSIDQDGREALWRVVRDTLERHRTPAVFVTHDPDEALALGDHLVRFERGRTTESGTPVSMVRRGHPVVVRASLDGAARLLDGGRAEVLLRGGRLEAPAELLVVEDGTELVLELRTRPREKKV